MNAKGPRSRQSYKPDTTQRPFSLMDYQLSFDVDAFSNMIMSQGIKMTHYRAIPDPTGMQSKGDVHDAIGNRKSSDGFLYIEAGNCRALFTSNSGQVAVETLGVLAFSTAYLSFPDKYEGKDEPILITQFDRFFLEDIEARVVTSQFIEANSNGIDKLQYPATCIEYIVDANNIIYCKDDYELTAEGDIKWLTQKRPGWNPSINKGTIYSVRYRYTPFFIVNHILHEIRVAQVTDMATGDRNLVRMPYQVMCMRENVYRDVNQGDPNKVGFNDDRFDGAPPVGGQFGSQF